MNIENVIRAAERYVGVSETEPNARFSNSSFAGFLKRAGWSSGQPYCMFFALACFLEGTEDKALRRQIKQLSGSTQAARRQVQAGRFPNFGFDRLPLVNGIAIWQSKRNSSLGHAGIITSVKDERNFTTIEGNTDALGSRRGDGVYIKERTTDGTNRLEFRGTIYFKS